MKFYSVLKQLRKQKGISQETLAEFLGISTQAVSKWECELSYPDIGLLPILAEYFQVSIDFLLTGSQCSRTYDSDRFVDDNTLYIVQYKGSRLLTESVYDPSIRIMIKAEDTMNGPVEIWGSADIKGNISGDVQAGDGVNCGNVAGAVYAGDGVNCGNVSGDVHAGDGVNCGNVGRNVNAGDDIHCANIGGDIISCDGDIYCREIGSIHCTQIVHDKDQ